MFNSLTRDAVFLVFDILPLSSLVILCCTCRLGDSYFAQYIANRLKITLGRFVKNEDDFLQEMSSTCAVIGGSAAVAILGRCRWTPNNLDVYIPQPYFSHVISYLIRVEHCEVLFDHLRGDLAGQVAALGCYALRLRTATGESIIAYRTPRESALLPLARSWGTIHMCYISATSLTIAYPCLADDQRSLLRPCRLLQYLYPAGDVLALIRKYEAHGIQFRLAELAWQRELDLEAECPGAGSLYCPLTVRYLGDLYTVTTSHRSLSDRRLHLPPVDYLQLETLLWWEGGQACDAACTGHGDITQPREHILATVVLPTRGETFSYLLRHSFLINVEGEPDVALEGNLDL